MNRAFNIQSAKIETSNSDLFIEVNAQGFSYSILAGNRCIGLAVYHFDAGITDDMAAANIHRIITDNPVLQQRFKTVHIIYSYSPFVLVPHQYMNGTDNNAMLELVYGDSGAMVVRTDFMYRHAIHIVYRIPSAIDQAINRSFELAQSTHLFSLLPDIARGGDNLLYCIFSNGQLRFALFKEGKLQVMQSHAYQSSEDVAFHLLNVCNRFDVDVDNVQLVLSGMIDELSELYSELYKYFLGISFETLPEQYEYPEEMQSLPAHYFSHLFLIAACV